ncbi:MAG: DNA polymerase IV [Candidatus Micrarchaeia archaeon]
MEKRRIIAHVDMDSFFTSCEELRRPELKGKPVVVGADPKGGKGRGVVSTASYEARKFGIRSGMPISVAYRKCPDCIFLPVDFDYYLQVSEKIMKMLRKYSDKIEIASIDEAYLDLSSLNNYENAKEKAEDIKNEVRKMGLSCSIGIGPNKLIAKIASDYKKPDGLTMVTPEEVHEFLNPLNVRVIPGIGPKTSEFLKDKKIETISDLIKVSKTTLQEWLGKFGEDVYGYARGMDDSEIITEYSPKSFSREHTFEKDTDDMDKIIEVIDVISDELEAECKKEDVEFKTLTLKLRFEGFETHTRSTTLESYSKRKEDIKKEGLYLISSFYPFEKKIRLIGLKISNLKKKNGKYDESARISDYI